MPLTRREPLGKVPEATSEVEYSLDEVEFMTAVERYKRERRRPFPTCSEVLAVLQSLGYRKVAEPTELPRR